MIHHGDFRDFKQIGVDSIHLWDIALDDTTHSLEDYRSILSDQERERANRFSFPELKRRYIIAHACLREILAGYIDVEPRSVAFTTNAYEKPSLVEHPGKPDIHFNLSHSLDIAVIGIVKNRRIGVDVEWVKSRKDHMKIAERYFSPGEIAALKRIKNEQTVQAFIQLWAGKEAFIKARGDGMSLPLNQFSLERLIEHPGKISCKVELPGDTTAWFVYPIKLITGYLGAVAVEGEIRDIQYFKE